MTPSQEKVLQYLHEARASELALVSTLRAHVAMAPSGSYRTGLERHLEETKAHARRLQSRIGELGASRNAVRLGVGLAQTVVGQALALGKGPLDLVRGYSVEEKLLKNAKDEYAAEAHEIATYLALERLAEAVDDPATASLARGIREDEEAMLAHLGEEIPRLADAMVRAELVRDPAAAAAGNGPGQAETAAGEGESTGSATGPTQPTGSGPAAAAAAQRATAQPPPVADSAGSSPAAPAGSAATAGPPAPFPVAPGGGPATEDAEAAALPVEGYATMRVSDLLPRLAGLSPEELDQVEEYERGHRARSTVLTRIGALRQRGAPPAT
jgi:ferritin-like metal-binding protein YciE